MALGAIYAFESSGSAPILRHPSVEAANLKEQDAQAILGQLFSGGTALAGLVLVFLGGILTAYDTYDATAQVIVGPKYRRRAWLGFWGFLSALLAAAAGLTGMWFPATGPTVWLPAGILMLAVTGALLVGMALLSVLDIN